MGSDSWLLSEASKSFDKNLHNASTSGQKQQPLTPEEEEFVQSLWANEPDEENHFAPLRRIGTPERQSP